jgi:molybdenum cofactor cytidylyltransferase
MPESSGANIAAVILAAGKSSRMGRTKALLKINNGTFLDTILFNIQQAGVERIFTVLGNDSADIIDRIPALSQCVILINPHPEAGPLSSLHIALKSMGSSLTGFLLALVDHPLVNQATYERLMHEAHPHKIVIPTHKNKNGHPVFFGQKFFKDLKEAPLNTGARHVVYKYPDHIKRIEVPDPGILHDIDLPEDYQSIIAQNGHIKSKKE